jgi:hypothetical protein
VSDYEADYLADDSDYLADESDPSSAYADGYAAGYVAGGETYDEADASDSWAYDETYGQPEAPQGPMPLWEIEARLASRVAFADLSQRFPGVTDPEAVGVMWQEAQRLGSEAAAQMRHEREVNDARAAEVVLGAAERFQQSTGVALDGEKLLKRTGEILDEMVREDPGRELGREDAHLVLQQAMWEQGEGRPLTGEERMSPEYRLVRP